MSLLLWAVIFNIHVQLRFPFQFQVLFYIKNSMDLHSWRYLCFFLGEHLFIVFTHLAVYSYLIASKKPSSTKVLTKQTLIFKVNNNIYMNKLLYRVHYKTECIIRHLYTFFLHPSPPYPNQYWDSYSTELCSCSILRRKRRGNQGIIPRCPWTSRVGKRSQNVIIFL